VVNFGGAGDCEYWGYIKFNLSNIPSSSTILNARLRLRVGYDSSPTKPVGTTNIYMINNNSWSEYSLIYDTRPDNLSLISSNQVTFGIAAYANWDVTIAVRNWIKYGYPNYGLVIKTSNIDVGFSYAGFYTRESASGYNFLEITYE